MKVVFGFVFGFILLVAGGGIWYVYFNDDGPVTLTVSAGPRGSDSHTLLTEIAEVAVRHSDTIRLNVWTSQNSSVNISRLHSRVVDLATIESNTPAYSDVHLVSDLFSDYFLFITRKGSKIYNVEDLPGHRIAIPEEGSSGSRSFWSVIDHYRVPPESFRSMSRGRTIAVEQFLSGAVDALFIVASKRDPFLLSFFEEAGQRGIGIRFVPVDQAQAMSLKRPFLVPSTIVRGSFDGSGPLPATDIQTPTLQRLLVAHAGVPEDAVRELVRIMFENKLDLLVRMPLSSSIKGRDTGVRASLPFHSGAQAYFDRDEPSFIQENAEPLALIVTVSAMLLSALVALRRSMNSRAKNRADSYNERLLEISTRARQSDDPEGLQAMKDELADVLKTVVHALDTDQVTEEGFQSFAFLWTSVKDEINDRLLRLSQERA